MNELKLYFNELYSKNIEKSDYEPLLQHLNQFNHALVTVLQEERMIVYDIINILMKLQFIYEMKEWY
ncbi:MAG: hypothetical protein LUH02_12400 [Erysipelotrichaceae bacterium]|nr:hypothetical protein [Erysipelotrichaceae bacterium]